jgi:hypothetical protein
VLRDDAVMAEVPGRVDYHARFKIGSRLPEPYHPPLFGITCLGPSHGFDPDENTSGFIIWLNHQGVMVDPPVNSTEWLESSNVNPKMIDSIVLTHCHADHDAGTFQKIMEEGKVTVYTTQTVMMSFLRKYSALTNIAVNDLLKLFNFHPVRFGEPVFINNARFEMFYSLHSIPTIGFKMYFQDQSFVYTSDHNNDPACTGLFSSRGSLMPTVMMSCAIFPGLRRSCTMNRVCPRCIRRLPGSIIWRRISRKEWWSIISPRAIFRSRPG